VTETDRREWRQMMARLADELDAVERLRTELGIDAAHRRDTRAAILDHEARITHLEAQ